MEGVHVGDLFYLYPTKGRKGELIREDDGKGRQGKSEGTRASATAAAATSHTSQLPQPGTFHLILTKSHNEILKLIHIFSTILALHMQEA